MLDVWLPEIFIPAHTRLEILPHDFAYTIDDIAKS